MNVIHVFLLTSGWALLLYSRRPRSPMHMQRSSARAVGFRSNEQIWFLTIGPKERKPSAVMLRALRMPPGEEVFHFFRVISGILNECWEKFSQGTFAKSMEGLQDVVHFGLSPFFPLHDGAIISLDELAFRWISWDQTLGEHEESFRRDRRSSIELEKTPKVS